MPLLLKKDLYSDNLIFKFCAQKHFLFSMKNNLEKHGLCLDFKELDNLSELQIDRIVHDGYVSISQ